MECGRGNQVVTWQKMRGTQLGPWMFVPMPTGRTVETDVLVAFEFDDEDQIVDQWFCAKLRCHARTWAGMWYLHPTHHEPQRRSPCSENSRCPVAQEASSEAAIATARKRHGCGAK